MLRFGLTGNMGCGKSTVATMLAQHPGVDMLDSDSLAKEVIYAPENWTRITEILGKDVFKSGKPDYKAIGNIFFGDNARKKELERFAGPLLWSAIEKRTKAPNMIHVVESALLFESRWENRFDGVIVATCPKKEQYRRLRESRNMDDAQIWARLRYQIPNEKKVARADFTVRTGCSFEELFERVELLYQRLKDWKGKVNEESSVCG